MSKQINPRVRSRRRARPVNLTRYQVIQAGVDQLYVQWCLPRMRPHCIDRRSLEMSKIAIALKDSGGEMMKPPSSWEGPKGCVAFSQGLGCGWCLGLFANFGKAYARLEMKGCLSRDYDTLAPYRFVIAAFEAASIEITGESIRRLDLATDLRGDYRPMLEEHIEKGHYRGRLKPGPCAKDQAGQGEGSTYYYGARGGTRQIRVYSKSSQLTKMNGRPTAPVTRFEFICREAALVSCDLNDVRSLEDSSSLHDLIRDTMTNQFCLTESKPDRNRRKTTPSPLWRAVKQGLFGIDLMDLDEGQPLPVIPSRVTTAKDVKTAMNSASGQVADVARRFSSLHPEVTPCEALEQIIDGIRQQAHIRLRNEQMTRHAAEQTMRAAKQSGESPRP